MQSPRAPLYVFFAAFLTFLIAFATLLTVLKPELDKRRAADSAASSDPTTTPAPSKPEADEPRQAVASLPAPAVVGKPAGKDSKPAGKDKRSDAKTTTVAIGVSGRVVDPKGSAVADAHVHVLVSGKGKGESSTFLLLTKPVGPDGAFSFEAAIPQSGAFLLATAPGFVRSDTKTLAANATSPIDVGSLALKHGGALRVRVSGDEVGKLAGAEVTLVDHGGGSSELAPHDISAKTGSDGVALLQGIDRGSYLVRARADGHADAESEWRFDGSGRNGTEEVALVLLPLSAWISGTALDVDRNPVTKGEVAVRLAQGDPPAQQEWRAPLDAHGQFRVGPLPKGTFKVEVVAPGIVQKSEVFAEADGESVELSVEHGGMVVGHLAVAGGEPADAPRITVWKVDGNGRTQPVDSSYRGEAEKKTLKFHVDGLGPGRYYVRAAADGFAPGRSSTFTLGAGETSPELAIELGEGGSLSGAVVDARGAPIRGARVSVFEGTAPPPPALVDLFPTDAHASVQSRDDGRFDFSLVSPGPVVLLVEAQGQAPRTIGPLRVTAGDEVRLGAMALGGSTILSATVAGARGKPVPFGCGLLLANDGSVRVPFVADENGNFCMRGLAQGDYVLSGADGTTGRTELTLRADETGRVQLTIEKR